MHRHTDSGLSITEWRPISNILAPLSVDDGMKLCQLSQTAEFRLQNRTGGLTIQGSYFGGTHGRIGCFGVLTGVVCGKQDSNSPRLRRFRRRAHQNPVWWCLGGVAALLAVDGCQADLSRTGLMSPDTGWPFIASSALPIGLLVLVSWRQATRASFSGEASGQLDYHWTWWG